jgi:hypothetical protein
MKERPHHRRGGRNAIGEGGFCVARQATAGLAALARPRAGGNELTGLGMPCEFWYGGPGGSGNEQT